MKKSNFWCNLLGHKINTKNNYTRYFRATGGALDGIKRHHINLYCDCDRCGENVKFGNIHGTESGNILNKAK